MSIIYTINCSADEHAALVFNDDSAYEDVSMIMMGDSCIIVTYEQFIKFADDMTILAEMLKQKLAEKKETE